MRNYFVLFFFIQITASAETEKILNFYFNKEKIVIYKYEESRVSSSVKCEKLKNGNFCEELSFLKTLKNYALKESLHSGQTYGSAICNEKLNGIIILVKTKLNDENAFCKLQNGMLVELGTLGYYYNLK